MRRVFKKWQKLLEKANKPEKPFQTMTSQKIANVILPDSPPKINYQNWQIAKISKLPKIDGNCQN